MLALLKDYLDDHGQRVVLNGQIFDGIPSLCKIFADDTSLFSNIHYIDISAKELHYDFEKISKSVFQWKMKFNPDPNKQANKVIFSRKSSKCSHPHVTFNNNRRATRGGCPDCVHP